MDLPPGGIAAALAAGRIDATATWVPVLDEARAALGDNALTFTDTKEIYGMNFLLIGRAAFVREHSRLMEKVVKALLKAEAFARSRPEEALSLVAAWLKVDVDALRPTWENFGFRVELKQSQLVTLEDQTRWALARGHAAERTMPNLLPHLYLDTLLAVRPERVTVLH